MSAFDLAAFRGSFPPLVAPFRDEGLDEGAYARLVDHVLREGSHGVVVNGTTGEPTLLTPDERTRLVAVAVRAAQGRVPVVAATGGLNLGDTLALGEAAERSGASALMVVTPPFVKPPVRGLVAFHIEVCRATSLPVLIYHIPSRSGVSLSPAAIAEARAKAPNLIGVKHASTDLAFVTELLALTGPEFRVFVGLEELSFPMMALGAAGLMNAAGNIAPRRVAALAEACLAGDMARARALHFELYELNQAIFWDTNPIPLKYMMKRMGLLATNDHRPPMAPATPELEARLDRLLERLGLTEEMAA